MDPAPRPFPIGQLALVLAALIIPLNVVVWFVALDRAKDELTLWVTVFGALAVMQFVLSVVGIVSGARRFREKRGGVLAIVIGSLTALGAVVGGFLGVVTPFALSGLGGAWGRPLRVRGRQLHPHLVLGSDWTAGARPDPQGLSEDDRLALEALWLHDAQKEHASVPAFARLSWLLAAVGAPAELVAWAHRAGLEEIDHTQRCFALAAGYGGRSHTVEPMPELLLGALEARSDPLATLARESLLDGCQLEDFNADVAAACTVACEQPETRGVLERIAREERSHADFSWALLEWLARRDGARVVPVVAAALTELERYPRPTAVSWDKQALVSRANPGVLKAHGRLPDARWAELWDQRLVETRRRVRALLEAHATSAAA